MTALCGPPQSTHFERKSPSGRRRGVEAWRARVAAEGPCLHSIDPLRFFGGWELFVNVSEFLALARHACSEEIKQAWIFLVLGMAACLAGTWLWKNHSAFRHALWPLCLVAVIQIAVGSATLWRMSDRIETI